MKLTANFELSEFACHDGTPVPPGYLANVSNLAYNLQIIRDAIGEPLHINSAYRTEAWNAMVGGEPKSYHLIAMAADIICRSKTPKQLARIIEKLIADKKISQGGLGVYPGWVHYDCRGTKARW